jgi:hypothetical protein
MLTHVHYSETLCGWQYRSKGEEKGVGNVGHGVTERIRQWDQTRPVLEPRLRQRYSFDRTLSQRRTGPKQVLFLRPVMVP